MSGSSSINVRQARVKYISTLLFVPDNFKHVLKKQQVEQSRK